MISQAIVIDSSIAAQIASGKTLEEVEKRYEYLHQSQPARLFGKIAESRQTLRIKFEFSALVYVPKDNAWIPPSNCIWVESRIRFPGKSSIADIYASKERFFTTFLKVPKPTMQMYIDSLKAEAKLLLPSQPRIKETMALIAALGVDHTDVSDSVEAQILPIRLPNGTSSFISASPKELLAGFCIFDSSIHEEALKDKVTALDFSMKEIRDTKPFLQAINLGGKFSSNLVENRTEVDEGSRDDKMTMQFRSKAQAFVRYVTRLMAWSRRHSCRFSKLRSS